MVAKKGEHGCLLRDPIGVAKVQELSRIGFIEGQVAYEIPAATSGRAEAPQEEFQGAAEGRDALACEKA